MASVSVDQLGPHRFKVRWRETVSEGGQRRTVARALTVSTREAAIELQAKVLRAVETVGYYESEARELPPVTNLERAAGDWLKHKAARGVAVGTVRRYTAYMDRFFRAVRALRTIGKDEVVPASVLSRTLFSEAILSWRAEGLSESMVYGMSSTALDMWRWVCDDPDNYPGVPVSPRDPSTVLPPPPIYVAPLPPTLAEVDACLRRLHRAYVAKPAAILMRFTGLRISQVLGLRCEDLDLANQTLCVRVGKSRREKAESRLVPISPHLVDEIAPWMANRLPEDYLVRRRKDQHAAETQSHLPTVVLSAAWEEATQAGEARREVWAPRSRKLSRPDHAFRAAFMAYLEEQGVRDSVIDYLVGHAPMSTRRRHYAPPGFEQLQEAVGKLPPIDWKEREEAEGGKVVQFRRG